MMSRGEATSVQADRLSSQDAWAELLELANALLRMIKRIEEQVAQSQGRKVGQNHQEQFDEPALPEHFMLRADPAQDLQVVAMNSAAESEAHYNRARDRMEFGSLNDVESGKPGRPGFGVGNLRQARPALPGIEWLRRFRNMIDRRHTILDDDLTADPCWDMLLDLCIAEVSGKRISVTSLCIAAHVAPTTALRWIEILTSRGWLERHKDLVDRRRTFVQMTPKARDAMARYFESIRD